jgi:hypothetical protein
VCSVSVCVNAGFIASDWAWHCEPMLHRWSERLDPGDGWACPRFGVTFEPRQVLPWAWLEVKGEVNEAVYIVGPDGRRGWREVNVVAMGWCCSAHTGNECVSGVEL